MEPKVSTTMSWLATEDGQLKVKAVPFKAIASKITPCSLGAVHLCTNTVIYKLDEIGNNANI